MQDLSGFNVPGGFRGGGAIKVQLWWAVQATLFRWSPQVMYRWRAFLLRMFGAKIGKNVVIRPSVKITYPWKLTTGDYSGWVMTRFYIRWVILRLVRTRLFRKKLFMHRES